MSTVSAIANVDWATVSAAVGTFIGAIFLTWKGAQRGKEKVETNKSEITSIVGASLIETASVQMLSVQLQENTIATRENTAEIRRQNDITVLMHRP